MELNSQSSQAVSLEGRTAKGSDPARWQNDQKASEKSAKLQSLVLKQLEDDKAEDIVEINLSGKSDVADVMVIASGRSQRHVGALADHIIRAMKEQGLGSASVEGTPACDWVLIDAGDVLVHLFRPEVREFYNLERIWSPEAFKESARKTTN